MRNDLFKKLAIATAGAAIAFAAVDASSAQAATLTYNFTGANAFAPSFTFTDIPSGITVTATATSTASVGVLNQVSQSANGLGVRADINDTLPRQIDGNGPDETLLLNFAQAVRLVSATFKQIEADDELVLRVDNISAFSGTIPLSGLLAFSPLGTTGNIFKFEALSNKDDFILKSAVFETVPVPEPTATLGLFAVGAFGAAALKRKQK